MHIQTDRDTDELTGKCTDGLTKKDRQMHKQTDKEIYGWPCGFRNKHTYGLTNRLTNIHIE